MSYSFRYHATYGAQKFDDAKLPSEKDGWYDTPAKLPGHKPNSAYVGVEGELKKLNDELTQYRQRVAHLQAELIKKDQLIAKLSSGRGDAGPVVIDNEPDEEDQTEDDELDAELAEVADKLATMSKKELGIWGSKCDPPFSVKSTDNLETIRSKLLEHAKSIIIEKRNG